MACEFDKKRKCFTFIWRVENADYYWAREADIESPPFTVEEINETNWKLKLYFHFNDGYCGSELFLHREPDKEGGANVAIDCELAFLSPDGTVLHSFEENNSEIENYGNIGCDEFPSRNEVFFARRSVFLSRGTFMVRCRMWKSVGEISKDIQCFARTLIAVEKRSFLWNIGNFSTLQPFKAQTHELKSLETGEQLMRLELFMSPRQILGEIISLKIIPNFKNIKTATIQLSIVDASKNSTTRLQEELWVKKAYDSKTFVLLYSKKELMEKKSTYLPNDVLSLLCECSFCFGIILQEIESGSSNSLAITNLEYDDRCLDKEDDLPVPKGIFINDFKSMLNNSMFSDVKLKTGSKTYHAHKLILGVRSPVFKAMFSNDMREKINDCVDIEDFSDETVLDMLRYLYSADVEELEWGRATELYEAADKYQILNLKDICSSYIKNNLCPNNACEALVLADLHQDDDLKSFVQDFILRQGEEIVYSEAWEQLMESNLKLAAETMRLKFKVLLN